MDLIQISEISKPVLIWLLTFFIGISSLIFININFNEKQINIIRNAFLVLLTIIFSFVFGYLEEKTPFAETLSEIASIGTPLIALFAYWEYKSKTANKVNEKQLDTVLEMISYFSSKKVLRLGMRDKKDKAYIPLFQVLSIKEETYDRGMGTKVTIEGGVEPNLDRVDRELLVDFQNELKKYINNPLIPKQINNNLITFSQYIDQKTIQYYQSRGYHFSDSNLNKCQTLVKDIVDLLHEYEIS